MVASHFSCHDEDIRGRRGLGSFVIAILPALIAIWAVPWFVTQDGPAHLYNAHIVAESLRSDSPFRHTYEVHWIPFPNWAGHLLLMGLLSVLPAYAADRVVMSLTLVGFAASVVWLRWRVAGWRGMPVATALAVLLALNLTWLWGFTSFLLGACLFPITLGIWWTGRDRMGPGRTLVLAGLMALGYFCHLVSLGLTAVGLVVLALMTPGPGRIGRGGWTLASLAPLVPLGLIYCSLAQAAGDRPRPIWEDMSSFWSLRDWAIRLMRANPLFLARQLTPPFLDAPSPWFSLLAPVSWSMLALGLLVLATYLCPQGRCDPSSSNRTRRGWSLLAVLLLVGSVVAPDAIGSGSALIQRLALFGLVALVPRLELDGTSMISRAGRSALAVAVALQSAFIWDYALYSRSTVGAFMQAKPYVGRGQRIGTLLLIDDPGRFRSSPLFHIDNMLGIWTGNIVWNNYETQLHYFPVRFRKEVVDHPSPFDRHWGRQLERYHGAIDVLVVWGTDPRLDALIARWFQPVFQRGSVRVLWRLEVAEDPDLRGPARPQSDRLGHRASEPRPAISRPPAAHTDPVGVLGDWGNWHSGATARP
jgi:hypothetical protein